MNVLLKIFILAILFLGFSIGSFWLIFSQGLLLGAAISLLLLVLCIGLLALGLYGIQVGQLGKIRLTSRMEVATLLILTVYLSSAIGLFGFANTLLELRNLNQDHTAVEKTEMLVSSFWENGSKPDIAGSTERNGVIYSYTESTKDEIQKVDEFLKEEKERIADFFSNEDDGELTIIFHDNFETLSDMSGYEEAMGFYDYYRQEIHIVPDDYSWDAVLLHEYSHHQSHLYAEKNRLADTRLPLWFEEGLADYLAGETSDWYELEDVEIIDFTSLNHDYSFHNSYTRKFDPYVQSFLAVQSLVNKYGEDQLKTLLPAEMPGEFYELLEETTGMEIADFQEIFLDEMIEESKAKDAQYDEVYQAIETGKYAAAQKTIEELRENASEEDLNQLSWMQTDLYLIQDKFDEAIEFMESQLESGDPIYRIDDLTTLAELNLLVDPGQSLLLIEEALILVEEDEDMVYGYSYYDLEGYLEAYGLVNSDEPLEGYQILLDEDFLYNETVIEKVSEIVEENFLEAG